MKRRYRVISHRGWAGHEEGEEFELDFSKSGYDEPALLGVHIELVSPQKSNPDPESEQ